MAFCRILGLAIFTRRRLILDQPSVANSLELYENSCDRFVALETENDLATYEVEVRVEGMWIVEMDTDRHSFPKVLDAGLRMRLLTLIESEISD